MPLVDYSVVLYVEASRHEEAECAGRWWLSFGRLIGSFLK